MHEEWLKKHDALPASKAEKQEYRELVRKEVSKRTDTGYLRVRAHERDLVCSFVLARTTRLPSMTMLPR